MIAVRAVPTIEIWGSHHFVFFPIDHCVFFPSSWADGYIDWKNFVSLYTRAKNDRCSKVCA
jgi:hypothetical protein